ncbi:MFS transporter [Luteipulveratus flavus]|uniref:MFS transporter n=1 Tax=Luteipulveratus flavus TaxID=3031728 RepID=A0ABT6CA24_9MICO|nr:MFS transporter [Luteipulveratus sp. YIM 133296]MDF8265645.1 MFS transporter [Luteipulveratus sp. YIM 133296]
MTATETPPSASAAGEPARLLSATYLPFAVGAVSLVTLGAFANRATGTVLPVVAEDLDGLALFGAASAAPLITYVVSTAVAGALSDRGGPTRVLRIGAAVFAVGQLLAGLAPTMLVLVLGRLLSGFAEAFLDIGLTVLMARALPESLRAKVFATFAAAWVLPSLVGPALAGTIADHVGWRAVFLLAVALLVPVFVLLLPSMRRTPVEPLGAWSGRQRTVARNAAGAAVLLAVLTAAGSASGTRWAAAAVIGMAAALAGLVRLVRRVLPDGTLTGTAGIPAVTASRGLAAAAFSTAGSFLPLMLTKSQGLRPALAGITLTLTGVCWATGSALHSLDVVQRRVSPTTRLRIGFGAITTGLAGPALIAADVLPLVPGLALWALAGLGMGVASPTLSTQMLALSERGEEGANSAASNMAASLAGAVGAALGGALVATRADHLSGGVFTVIIAVAIVFAALGLRLAPLTGVRR